MHRERAQEILELCQPDQVESLDDPLIAKAFEQLDQDSALSAWFEEQQMQDEKIRTEFNRITPPADLKASILAGMHARIAEQEGAFEESESDQTRRTSSILWFRPLIGIAALFVFASVFFVLKNRYPAPQITDGNDSPNSFATIDTESVTAGVPDVIQFLGQQIEDFNNSKFSKRSEQVDELKSYLKLAGAPSPAVVPQALEKLPTLGCVSFDYGGTQLSMICFKNSQVYHLITVDKANLTDNHMSDLSPADVHFFEHRNQVYKIWSKDDQIYILTTKGTKENISNVPEFI